MPSGRATLFVVSAAQPSRPPADCVTRWCAGLPRTGEAPLSETQRALVMQVYRGARARMVVHATVTLLLLPVSAVASLQLRAAFGPDSWIPIAVSMLVLFIGLPLAVAKTIALFRLVLPLRRDLAGGVVEHFGGMIANAGYEDEDPDVVQMVEAGALVRGEGEQTLGVLPASARLVHVNGRQVLPTRRLHVAAVATTAHLPLRFSLPPDVKQAFGMQGGLKRRRFGDAERRELVQHIARLTAVPWFLVLLTAFAALTVSGWVGRGMHSARELMGLGWIVAWGVVALRHVRSYLLARRFEHDLELGWLLSWETPESAREPARRADPSGKGMPFATAEVLPVSQMDWMIDGKPAAWRRVIQRAGS